MSRPFPGRGPWASIAALILAMAAVLTGPVSQTATAAAAPGCEHGFGTDTPVLLVHGFKETPSAWKPMQDAIGQARIPGVTVVAPFNYKDADTQWVSNNSIGPALATEISCLARASGDNGGWGKVILVAHSMGGLAIRCAVDPKCAGPDAAKKDQIGLVITLGTPNMGSVLATVGNTASTAGTIVLSPAGGLTCLALHLELGTPPCGDLLSWLLGANSPAATAMALGPEGKLSKDLQNLGKLPSGIPLDAIAGNLSVTTKLFDLPSFLVTGPEFDFGDIAVSVGSALDGAPHPGPGSGSSVINCGSVSLPALVRSDLLPGTQTGPAFSGERCWHLTEISNRAWQRTVLEHIRDYQSERPAPDWLNTSYTTDCTGVASQPFTVAVHNGKGEYQPDGPGGMTYGVAVTGIDHGYLRGDASPQTTVLLQCSPQPSNYLVTEIQILAPDMTRTGAPLRPPPHLVRNALYDMPYFEDNGLTIEHGLVSARAAYYGPNDCHACGPSIHYKLSWQWNGRSFTLTKKTRLSGTTPPAPAACPGSAQLVTAWDTAPASVRNSWADPSITITGFDGISCWNGWVVAGPESTTLGNGIFVFSQQGALHLFPVADLQSFRDAVCQSADAPDDWRGGTIADCRS